MAKGGASGRSTNGSSRSGSVRAPKAGTRAVAETVADGASGSPHDFGSGRDYRAGMRRTSPSRSSTRATPTPLGRLLPDPEVGGHVRKGEKGTPILYVERRSRQTARDERGTPVLDEAGRPKVEWVERDRPLVKLHHVFNVEQTEALRLRPLAAAAPAWEGHERAEAVMRNSGLQIDHVAGDRAYRLG